MRWGRDDADIASAKDVPPEPQHSEIGGLHETLDASGLNVQSANPERAGTAGHPPSHLNGVHAARREPDAAAEEHDRRQVPDRPTRTKAEVRSALHASKGEDTRPFEKELSFLREEQAETGQVDLLLILLDLREVGVVGEVGNETPGQPVLDIESGVRVPVVRHDGLRVIVGYGRRDAVGLELQIPRRCWSLQPDQRRGFRHPVDPPWAVRPRNEGQVRVLVLPLDRAANIDAPDLIPPSLVPERLERNGYLHNPALLERRSLHVPDRVPVPIDRLALVTELLVSERPERIRLEHEAIPAVVERVEHHRDALVLVDAEIVPPHFVDDHPLRVAVPAAHADVDVPVVEKNPGLGFLRSGLALVGHLLDEVADRSYPGIDGVVQLAIEDEGLAETVRAKSHSSLVVASHHFGRLWRGWSVQVDVCGSVFIVPVITVVCPCLRGQRQCEQN